MLVLFHGKVGLIPWKSRSYLMGNVGLISWKSRSYFMENFGLVHVKGSLVPLKILVFSSMEKVVLFHRNCWS